MSMIADLAGITPDRCWAVEGVASLNAGLAWPFVWPLLAPSIAVIPEDLRPSQSELAGDVVTGAKQLWIAWDLPGDCCEGALLTEIRDGVESLTGERICLIYAAGGRGVRRWAGWMSRLLRPWAAAQGCRMILHGGRRGWMRVCGTVRLADHPEFGPVYGRPTIDN